MLFIKTLGINDSKEEKMVKIKTQHIMTKFVNSVQFNLEPKLRQNKIIQIQYLSSRMKQFQINNKMGFKKVKKYYLHFNRHLTIIFLQSGFRSSPTENRIY